MSHLTGLDPLTGVPQYIDVAFGNPADSQNPAVVNHADTTAHGKLDLLKQSIDLLRTPLTPFKHNPAQTSGVVKASPGLLMQVHIYNQSQTNTHFLMLFNQTTVPSASSTAFILSPIVIFPGSLLGLDYGIGGISFGVGISYGLSSNIDSFTAIATPNDIRMWIGVQ